MWRLAAATTLASCSSAMQLGRNSGVDKEHYLVDDADGLGLTFEGVGAISGGGATSKLLFDYPKETQAKILDVLFKPGQGLNLQMLKVEIGGDTDATEGAEPSHSHFAGDENYNRGYEWWLMKEAKGRNPDIKLYGLPWGFPGGLDPDANSETESFDIFHDARVTANYTLNWVLAAKRVHGLEIDYVGLWNEKDAPSEYRMALRSAIANSEAKDRTKVLDRIEHYAGSTNDPDEEGCQQHNNLILEPGEQWADEEGSMYDGRSARCLARVLNRGYISKCKTATIQWHLISSFYDYLPWPRCGLAVANEPWSGAFEITSPLWAVAHTTQFAPIGWKYARHGSGVHMLSQGGSMVTRVSPDRKDFSIVIEKMQSATSVCGHGDNPDQDVTGQTISIQLKGAFLKAVKEDGKRLHVWHSDLTSSDAYGENPPDNNLFNKIGDLVADSNGIITVSVSPEVVMTITTLEGGLKATPTSPAKAPFPAVYEQKFDDEQEGAPGRLWYDVMGAWEVQKSPYGDEKTHGNVLRQVVPVFPKCWGYRCESPTTFFGPAAFKGDITLSMDVRMENDGEIYVNPVGLNYVALSLSTEGTWGLGSPPYITGALDFGKDKWHSVQLRMKPDGSQVATVDGKVLNPPPSASLLSLGFNISQRKLSERCDENTFPVLTTGRRYLSLKPVSSAPDKDSCRWACCLDENLCDIYQFSNEKGCEMGRMAEGWTKDTRGVWDGASRSDATGWHLKMKLSKYMYASIDNLKIFKTNKAKA